MTIGFYDPVDSVNETDGEFFLMSDSGQVETAGTVVGAAATELPVTIVTEPGLATIVGLMNTVGDPLPVRLFTTATPAHPYFDETNVALIPPCPPVEE